MKNSWFWNIILVLTVILCVTVLTMHFKNWVSHEGDTLKLKSGFYNVEVPYIDLDSIILVERLPPMERLNGFSALEKEKGIFRAFKDSLTNKKVYVFVDNINQQKLKIVYKDSSHVYVNLKDSVKTLDLMHDLTEKVNANNTTD